MKPLILAASISIVLAGVAGEAAAACVAGGGVTAVTGTANLTTLLSEKTVCVKDSTGSGWEWQEEHRGGPTTGELWDYKLGKDPIDPTEKVGSWTVSRSGVNHNYGSGGTYNYTVFNNGNRTYSFCAGRRDIVATIKDGRGPC